MDKVAMQRLLDRARELADSGRFPNWREVAEALAEEGFNSPVRNLSRDPSATEMLDLRCAETWRKGDYPRPATCPCCKFPTLNDNGGFEICVICWWEDDGQTDQDADEVRGVPNSHYSLTQAQKNFANHGHMYDQDQGIQAVEQPSSARRELMDYLDSIARDPAQADPTRLGALLSAEDRHVRSVGR